MVLIYQRRYGGNVEQRMLNMKLPGRIERKNHNEDSWI